MMNRQQEYEMSLNTYRVARSLNSSIDGALTLMGGIAILLFAVWLLVESHFAIAIVSTGAFSFSIYALSAIKKKAYKTEEVAKALFRQLEDN